VLARRVRNRRLYDAVDQWAFCALSTSPGARAFHDQRRAVKTHTTKPCAPSGTASSASCTAAYATTPSTTNTPPGHTAKPPPLDDKLRPWDAYKRRIVEGVIVAAVD
jgi:hypothetical protein